MSEEKNPPQEQIFLYFRIKSRNKKCFFLFSSTRGLFLFSTIEKKMPILSKSFSANRDREESKGWRIFAKRKIQSYFLTDAPNSFSEISRNTSLVKPGPELDTNLWSSILVGQLQNF